MLFISQCAVNVIYNMWGPHQLSLKLDSLTINWIFWTIEELMNWWYIIKVPNMTFLKWGLSPLSKLYPSKLHYLYSSYCFLGKPIGWHNNYYYLPFTRMASTKGRNFVPKFVLTFTATKQTFSHVLALKMNCDFSSSYFIYYSFVNSFNCCVTCLLCSWAPLRDFAIFVFVGSFIVPQQGIYYDII